MPKSSTPPDPQPDYIPEYDQRQWLRDKYDASKHRRFAQQIVQTSAPYSSVPVSNMRALDVGSGNGYTTVELSEHCQHVTGIELSSERVRRANELKEERHRENLEFQCQSVFDLDENEHYDLVILDNVFEHLPDQASALKVLERVLRPGGVLFILTPNKLWPVEVHYRLPFLSYLPLGLANAYLRLTGRGTDYTDCSYCPTYFGMRRMLRKNTKLVFSFVTPANLKLAAGGASLHYRLGVAAIRNFPLLWAISKALLVVAVKPPSGKENA